MNWIYIIILLIFVAWISSSITKNYCWKYYRNKYNELSRAKTIPFDDYSKKLKNEVQMYQYLQDLKKSCASNEAAIVVKIIKYYNELTSNGN